MSSSPSESLEAPATPTTTGARERGGRLTYREPTVLRSHPAYEDLVGSALSYGKAARSGAANQPVTISQRGIVVDGHARWQTALERQQRRLLCLELELTDDEALELLIERHGKSHHLNAFTRVALALRLEPAYKAVVLQRLKAGRSTAPPSILTRLAHRDVRSEIARLAGVSTGNVTKVKQLLGTVVREVRNALRQGEVSIHRAWQWRGLARSQQRDALWAYQNRKNIDHAVRRLIKQQSGAADTATVDVLDILRRLNTQNVHLTAIIADIPGVAIVVTRELYNTLIRDFSRES